MPEEDRDLLFKRSRAIDSATFKALQQCLAGGVLHDVAEALHMCIDEIRCLRHDIENAQTQIAMLDTDATHPAGAWSTRLAREQRKALATHLSEQIARQSPALTAARERRGEIVTQLRGEIAKLAEASGDPRHRRALEIAAIVESESATL